MSRHRFDLVIVGMGSAGMVAAEFAATLPIRVAAVERERVGGDCLWTGCVPSKAFLASAKVAHAMRTASRFGIAPVEPEVDTARVFARIREVQAQIAATDDSPRRFTEGLGVTLFEGDARLVGPHAVAVGDELLETRFVLLCTGSDPVAPPIPGLAEAGFLTSETVWQIDRAPGSLVLLGGGPISMEMAQGFNRLGVPTTVLERADRVLPRDEQALVARLVAQLRAEGVVVRTEVEVERVSLEDGLKVCHAGEERFAAEELVVAVGREANLAGLGLEELGVRAGRAGVEVDDGQRTSVSSVYAAGDASGPPQFTHSAGFEGVRAVRNMFFPGRSTSAAGIPWCTFTDPELAHAGLTAAEARERFGPEHVEVHRRDLSHSDRARAEAAEDGEVLVVCHRDRFVGAHVLAPAAGELIGELALAIEQELKLAEVGSVVHVYPTLATDVGQLAAEAAFARAGRFKRLVRSHAA